MRSWRTAAWLLLSSVGLIACSGSGASVATRPLKPTVTSRPPSAVKGPVYLALGDSAAIWNGDLSYPNRIAGYYTRDIPKLELVNMACSRETTSTMMSGSYCAPGGSQFQNALSFLRARRGSVALVTIDIGGNDVYDCISARDGPMCFANGLVTMQRNLGTILAGLRAAVGPRVPIVGMNVYNPLLGDWLAPPGPARSLADAAIGGIGTLNGDMESVYRQASSPVADVQGAFRVSDLTHLVSSPWGQVPVAVERACTLLNITCRPGQPEVFGDDPNRAGAAVIAQAFERVIARLHLPARANRNP